MIRTLDFNTFTAGTVIDDEYEGVTISATGGSGKAMIFDSANPTGGDDDLGSDTLGGVLIISEDGDSTDPDDNAAGGSICFDFDDVVRMKSITLKDIEETTGEGTRLVFYDANGDVIADQFVEPTGDGGEVTLQLFVPGTARLEVRFAGSGAVDNVTFVDDSVPPVEGPDGVVSNDDEDALIDIAYTGDPEGDMIDNGDALLPGEAPEDDIVDAQGGNDTILAGLGNDEVYAGAGDDVVEGGDGNDVIWGDSTYDAATDGSRGSWTGGGNDNLSGGDGNDKIVGEQGDDTLTGGDGADSIYGGDDADVIVGGDSGDQVDGGSGGNDNDTLDLRNSGPLRIIDQATDADGNSTSGTVQFLDADDNVTGSMTFTEIENLLLPEDENGDPITVDDMLVTDEDTASVPLNVLDNDSDPDGDTLTLTGATSPDGEVSFSPTGEVVFTPAENFNGPTTITYTVSDGNGGTGTGTVDVTVNPINDAPDAVDGADTTDFDTAITVDLLANDTDVENPDDLSVIAATVPAAQGTLVDNGDGTVTFTPVAGFTGEATISYTIEDPEGLTDSAVHVVTVDPDDTPTTVPDGYVDGDDDGNLIDVDYDGDPNGDFIDNDDAILPGTSGDDDYVRAGGGDDTVEAGQGSDTVEGGAGDDVINTGNGDLAPDLGYPFAATDPLGYDPDTDPEDDRDSVDGGDGNDTITTGDDRDTITGGAGNDVINAGIDDDIVDGGADDDRIVGGEGNDSILGGAGNDTIYAGNDPDVIPDVVNITDEDTGGVSPDRNPDNGQDTVNGGAGDDVIYGADDDDVLSGGSGNDYIDGEIDDDIINGNTGNDTLLGGQGDDSISGGQGDDELDGGIGDDTLRGNRDNDTLVGGDGNDSLDGGGEDDELFGGEGDDSMMGGQGDDLLDGGAGVDTMTGGAGQDTFVNVNAGDNVDGGSGAIDYDTLDLRGSAPEGGNLTVTYTSADHEDGFVTYFDEDGNPLAETLVFEEIENVIPCFTPGTRIATPKGERRVEELQVGDRVITRDNGIQEIRWVGQREMSAVDFDKAAHLKPVLIRQGALGNDLPERDMMVSPNHRVLVANDKTALYFEEREVLVAAKHLTGLEGVDIVDVSSTTYIHVMFDQHEVILSDGAWTESFQPGDMSLAGIGNAQRQEILELFPELATQDGIEAYASARRSLKKHEAKLLTK